MSRIRIIKKNDESSPEYEVGDVFETAGTWYGGVHIKGRSGIPVSLDREEYEEAKEAPAAEVSRKEERGFRVGDIVRHFKRELVSSQTSEYLYKILAFAKHTETGEELVVYQALYAPFAIYARPCELFMSRTDSAKYPQIRQEYRFEKEEG